MSDASARAELGSLHASCLYGGGCAVESKKIYHLVFLHTHTKAYWRSDGGLAELDERRCKPEPQYHPPSLPCQPLVITIMKDPRVLWRRAEAIRLYDSLGGFSSGWYMGNAPLILFVFFFAWDFLTRIRFEV